MSYNTKYFIVSRISQTPLLNINTILLSKKVLSLNKAQHTSAFSHLPFLNIVVTISVFAFKRFLQDAFH